MRADASRKERAQMPHVSLSAALLMVFAARGDVRGADGGGRGDGDAGEGREGSCLWAAGGSDRSDRERGSGRAACEPGSAVVSDGCGRCAAAKAAGLVDEKTELESMYGFDGSCGEYGSCLASAKGVSSSPANECSDNGLLEVVAPWKGGGGETNAFGSAVGATECGFRRKPTS